MLFFGGDYVQCLYFKILLNKSCLQISIEFIRHCNAAQIGQCFSDRTDNFFSDKLTEALVCFYRKNYSIWMTTASNHRFFKQSTQI